MCMDPSPTRLYRVVEKVSNVIGDYEPSTVSVFLSVVKCGRACTMYDTDLP